MSIVDQALTRRPYYPEQSRIIFSTSCSGLQSHSPMRARQTEAELKATDEVMSVVLAQPHRKGLEKAPSGTHDPDRFYADDARLSEPLGRFCAAKRLREECYRAGSQYAEIVRQAKSAMGFRVPGLVPNKEGLPPTDAELERNKIEAFKRLDNANCVLVAIMYRLPRAMEKFVYDQLEPAPNDEDIIRAGLIDLVDHFSLLDRGINRGRRF